MLSEQRKSDSRTQRRARTVSNGAHSTQPRTQRPAAHTASSRAHSAERGAHTAPSKAHAAPSKAHAINAHSEHAEKSRAAHPASSRAHSTQPAHSVEPRTQQRAKRTQRRVAHTAPTKAHTPSTCKRTALRRKTKKNRPKKKSQRRPRAHLRCVGSIKANARQSIEVLSGSSRSRWNQRDAEGEKRKSTQNVLGKFTEPTNDANETCLLSSLFRRTNLSLFLLILIVRVC